MSGCALKRWGAGTPCTREPDTAAKKELAARLQQMRAEREKQDTLWLAPAAAAAPSTDTQKQQPLKYTSS